MHDREPQREDDKHNPLSEGLGRLAVHETPTESKEDIYESLVAEYAVGPQIEGLEPQELEAALSDPRTRYLDYRSESLGSEVRLPFLAPIEHAGWLNPDFLARAGYDTDKLLYSILPQELQRRDVPWADLEKALKLAADGSDLNVLIDYPEFVQPATQGQGVEVSMDPLLTENGTPAATYHYETVCKKVPEAFDVFQPDASIIKIGPEEVDGHFDRIWEIYEDRFKALVDDHPIAGAMPREALMMTLKSEATSLHAYFDEEGEIQSFGYVVEDLALCPWLNKKFFDKESDGKPLVYMPGIASSPKAYVSTSTKIMNNMLYEQLQKNPEFVLTFECSNKSATYIPRLVKRAFAGSGLVQEAPFIELKHFYRVMKLSPQSLD